MMDLNLYCVFIAHKGWSILQLTKTVTNASRLTSLTTEVQTSSGLMPTRRKPGAA